MKKLAILLITVSLSFGAMAVKDNKKATNTLPILTGQVVDHETGEKLAGAMVKVDGAEKCVFTDFDGQFEITGLTPGNYKLEVSLISYNSNNIKELKLVGGDQKALKVELKR